MDHIEVTGDKNLRTQVFPLGVAPEVGPGLSADSFTVTEIARILRKQKYLILAAVLLFLGLAIVYILMKTPIYESVGTIEIDPRRSNSFGLGDLLSSNFSGREAEAHLKTEVQILESNTVALNVLKSLDPKQAEQLTRGAISAAEIRDIDSVPPRRLAGFLGAFRANLKVEIIPDTRIINVRFRDPDPQLAATVANRVLEAYMERNLSSRYMSAKSVSEWLSKQMDDIKNGANRAEAALSEFQKKNNLLGTDESNNIVTEKLKLLNEQLTQAEADRIVKEARYRVATSGDPELIGSIMASTSLQVLRTQHAGLRTQFAELSTKFGPGYPKVRDLQGQLAKVEELINTEVGNIKKRMEDEYKASLNTENALRSQFERQKERAFELGSNAGQYSTLKHEVESNRSLYDLLQMKLKEAGITAGLSSVDVSLVDKAMIPPVPASPRKPMAIGFSLLIGLTVGIALAFLRESLDTTVQSIEDVEFCAQSPVLAVVPLYRSTLGLNGNGARKALSLPQAGARKEAPAFITLARPNSAEAESYRSLRSSILFSSLDRPVKTLMFTSPYPGDGKSTTAANFAIALAQRGQRVLIVDADLRRPSLHGRFAVPQAPGLSSLLLGNSNPEQAFLNPISVLPNLFMLPAGVLPPSSAETLGSRRMKELLTMWEGQYDFVLLDTSPVLSVSDVPALARSVHSVVLVVRSGQTPKGALRRASYILSRAQAHIMGIVFNAVGRGSDYAYSYGYGYYGKGGEDEDEISS